ncbi:MAG: TonB-dependent receptor [Dokdonella sp.]|uniref:TonB-dependent receptor n=1 Tax=Dokdonella sp. TaxID=2291710 RepID=UPI0032668C40
MLSSFPRSALAATLGLAACGIAPAVAEETEALFEENAQQDDSRSPRKPRSPTVQGSATPWLGDAVQVTAKGTAADWPTTLATELLDYQDAIGAPGDFQDLVTRVPGVGATGQNGLFETFSIRGSGGNEILILVAGMPVTAQRRAGVPVAFVEPSLLGEINVTRGPSVVHFGAGALGGAISIEPRWFGAPTAALGYASAGNEANVMAGIGSDSFSVGVARHQAGDSEAPDGTPLNTQFQRESATAQYRTRVGEFDVDALLMPSRTENIGKSNSRYPTRDTTYPEDSHTLGRVRLRHDSGFQASVQAHAQYLGTHNQRPNTPDTFAAISSTDIGSTVQQTFDIGDFSNDVGIEYLGRRNVTGYDAVQSVHDRTYSLRDASEDSWSLFALTDWRLTPQFALEFGGRYTTTEQDQSGAGSSDSDKAFTAGAVWTPTDASRWTFNLASGYRFATLEERFYTGVTAQGGIIGNPDLGSEHSLGIDLGYALQSGDFRTEIHAWRMNVDDLIQLIELQPDIQGYVNVGKGKLHGLEAAVDWAPSADFSLRATGAIVRGKDGDGSTLYGIPPLSAALEARYTLADVTLGARYSHRWSVTRPGFEELERASVDVVDAELRYPLRPDLDVQLYMRNAFDEQYYATSDELSTFAQERSIGINVVWTMQ